MAKKCHSWNGDTCTLCGITRTQTAVRPDTGNKVFKYKDQDGKQIRDSLSTRSSPRCNPYSK